MTEAVSLPVGVVESGISIPSQLQTPIFGFIRLGKCSKEPIDKAWQFLARDTRWDDPVIQDWMRNGGNYGIVPLSGDVCILDCDDEKLIDAIVEAGATTFSVATGSGGKHYYFRCFGLGDKKIVIYDNDDKHLGEVYPAGCSAYCVGPNCIHPNGNSYGPDDYDIVRFEDFRNDILPKFKSKFNQTQEAQPKPEHRETVSGFDNISDYLRDNHGLTIMALLPPVDGKWSGDEFEGSHPIHGSTNGHNWRINRITDKACCFRCGTGTRDIIQVVALKLGLIQCKDIKTQITGDDYEQCLNHLRDLGYSDAIDEFYRLRKAAQETAKYTQLDEPLPKVKYHKLDINLSSDNFISKYTSYWSKMTDAYPDYHIAGAITLLSIVSDRKLFFDHADGKLNLNTWVFILGPSSLSRKTTAISKVREILSIADIHNLLSGSFSPEGLFEELSEKPHALLLKDEAADILDGLNRKQYMSGLRDSLCRFYDGYGEKRKLKSGKNKQSELEVKNPYLVCLWGTTPESFERSVTDIDVTSGLLLRFIYVNPCYPKQTFGMREKTGDEDAAFDELADNFHKITNALSQIGRKKIRLTPNGYSIMQKWADEKGRELLSAGIHGSIFSRYEKYAAKLAALFYVGDPSGLDVICNNNDIIEIPDEFLHEALRQMNGYYLPVAGDLIASVKDNVINGVQTRILSALKKAPGMVLTRTKLLSCIREVKASDLNDHLDYLEESNQIRRYSDRVNPTDKKPTLYIQFIGSQSP